MSSIKIEGANSRTEVFIKHYNILDNPYYTTLKDLAESHERNWYIMFKRLNGEEKFDNGRKINTNNFNFVNKNWKQELKDFIRMPGQELDHNKDIYTTYISDNKIKECSDALYDVMEYNTDKLIRTGIGTLGREAQEGKFYKFIGNRDVFKGKIGNSTMWNGIKTEFMQAIKRMEWAKKYDIDIYSNTAETKQTYDLIFKASVEKEKNGNNFLRNIPFEEKTRLSTYHIATLTDFGNKIDYNISPLDNKGYYKCTLYIPWENLKAKLDERIHSKLEATPVYESPNSLMLPSEVLESYAGASENYQKNKVGIFLDGLKLIGMKDEVEKLEEDINRTKYKYNLWYGKE